MDGLTAAEAACGSDVTHERDRRVPRRRRPRPEVAPLRAIPDWICEIVSPTSENRDRVVKAQFYAEVGVAHYWIVSPEARTVEAYELEPAGERPVRRWVRLGAGGDGDTARIPPFDAVELEVGRWFLPRAPAP
ncbi:MAG: Uma2 family endonuclease [Polyangiaceae bacterium]|nr:Uma2 family endonuclease [Polyangiaceae bacterium]